MGISARPGTETGTLTDATGTILTPAGPNARIACLVPSITELIIALGLADRLVARTQFCIHPADTVATIPSIGGTKKVSLPKLRALAPTHAILNIDENTREMADALAAFVPNIVVTHPLAPEDNRDLFRLLGGIFGAEAEADRLCSRLDEALKACRAAARDLPALDVVYFIWKDPWMTVSADTYISRMLDLVGWRTLLHDPKRRYPEVAVTPDLVADADRFLFSSEPYAFTEAHLDAFAAEYDCPRAKLLLVDGEYCSWYGPRAIDGLGYLAKLAKG
jgi:ABC-type Fe3+-hydroxamate transport system substrate-binding protein